MKAINITENETHSACQTKQWTGRRNDVGEES